MRKLISSALLLTAFASASLAFAEELPGEGMLLDYGASKVIAKYQSASCEDLKAMKNQPQSEMEKQALEFLRNDDQAREAFINQIAAPVANKMFECGMFP